MSDYGHLTTPQAKPSFVPSLDVAAKNARKKLLAEVEQRRRENYKQFYTKLALRRAK
jgi:hypothetical protein